MFLLKGYDEMITAGVDCGAKNTKAVIIAEGEIIGKGKVQTGLDHALAGEKALAEAIEEAGIRREDIQRVCGTGSGRNRMRIAERIVDDIEAVARCAFFFFPTARTVADVGAEDGRAAKLDENGNVLDHVVNERCAAGAGVFIESMARALDVGIEEMGPMCLQSETEIAMNAQCAVFAESEVVHLIHSNTPKPDISKAVHDAIAGRIATMVRRIGINKEVVLLGGLGGNPAIVAAIERELQLERLLVPEAPEFGAAVGAAVAAAEESEDLLSSKHQR